MRGPARRLWWVAPILLVAASGCSSGRPSPWGSAEPPEPAPSRPAIRLVAEADDVARRGQGSAALATYERVLREYPGDPAGAAALYGIGRLQTDPGSGLRSYRAAHRTFSRLLADYPGSHFQADARAWRTIITELIAREEDAARVKEDAGRMREEATRLRMQIEQLRRTDLDLERRR